MPTSCSVMGCKSRVNAGPKKQFFRFPLNRPKVLQQWLMVLDRLDWTPKPSSKICSDHFSSEDFLYRPNVNVPRLKPEAVPSIFPDPDTTQDDIDEMRSVESPIDEEEILEDNQENLNENLINVDLKQPEKTTSSPIADDVYSKRPKRTSKINVKMKDFILLDDLKKINKSSSLDPAKSKSFEKEPSPDKSEVSNKSKLIEKTEASTKFKLNDKTDDSLKSNLNKDIEVSKVDAAKELLSILEDSDDDLQTPERNENGGISDEETTSGKTNFHSISNAYLKVDKKIQNIDTSPPSVRIAEIASKVKAASCPIRIGPARFQQNRSLDIRSNKLSSTASIEKKSSSARAAQQGEKNQVTQLSKNVLLDSNDISSGQSSEDDEESATYSELKPKSNSSGTKIARHLRTKRPSTDLAKTYFPIRCGENFFYFSYADLNPVVDLSRHNILMNEDSENEVQNNIEEGKVSKKDCSINKNRSQFKRKLKRRNEDTNNYAEKRKKLKKDQFEEKSADISEDEENLSAEHENNVELSALIFHTSGKSGTSALRSENSENNSDDPAELDSENISDQLQSSDNLMDLETAGIIPSLTKKRKKRFKTVAEIIVTTDNAKPGDLSNVSIDQINKIVEFKAPSSPKTPVKHAADFKAPKSPAMKKVKKGTSNRENANAVDVNDNLNHITISNAEEPSEEELARLSERITETVKKMKLLDKVKGNTSKLTVLITTLPPVKEKEILIIKKKNLETNTIQSRELQVVISSNKTNETSLNGNIVVTNPLGYTILPAAKSDITNKSPSNDSFSKISDDCGSNGSTADQEHATIVCYQDKRGSKENTEKNKDGASYSGENFDLSDMVNESFNSVESEDNENNSGEAIIHDHPYITPNVRYVLASPNVSLNLSEVQSKETPSKMKLSENEIVFRNKVCKKLRNLKDNIKKKNDAIGKLKDKIRFLERTLKEVKRNRKQPAKIIKKDSNSLLKNDIFYGVDQLVDNSDFSNTMDYSLNNMDLPLGLEENAEESEDDDGERECSSPITYLCEPAIEVPPKDRDNIN